MERILWFQQLISHQKQLHLLDPLMMMLQQLLRQRQMPLPRPKQMQLNKLLNRSNSEK
jgi:hypothetical protein